MTLKSGDVTWYQPQVESWAGQKQITAWSAVSYLPLNAKEPALGTVKIEGPNGSTATHRKWLFGNVLMR